MKHKTLLLLISLSVISCNQKTTVDKKCNAEIIPIELPIENPLNFSNLFSDVRFIKLETSDDNLLPEIHKMKITNEKFYFLTNMPYSAVFVFNKTGEFEMELQKYGKGPGEFSGLEDIFIDTIHNNIELYDRASAKNIIYDLEGSFIDEWHHGLYYSNFYKTKVNNYLICPETNLSTYNDQLYNKNLIILNQNKDIIDTRFEFKKGREKFMSFSQFNNFYQFNNKTSFLYSYNDTIYSIDNNLKTEPRYIVDFLDMKLSPDVFEKDYYSVIEFSEALQKTNSAYHVRHFRELENHISFTFTYKKWYYLAIYSKKTKIIKLGKKAVFDIDNLKFKTNVAFNFSCPYANNKELIFILEPQKIIKWVEGIKKSNPSNWDEITKNSKLYKIYKELDINDNPVLMFCKLKEF